MKNNKTSLFLKIVLSLIPAVYFGLLSVYAEQPDNFSVPKIAEENKSGKNKVLSVEENKSGQNKVLSFVKNHPRKSAGAAFAMSFLGFFLYKTLCRNGKIDISKLNHDQLTEYLSKSSKKELCKIWEEKLKNENTDPEFWGIMSDEFSKRAESANEYDPRFGNLRNAVVAQCNKFMVTARLFTYECKADPEYFDNHWNQGHSCQEKLVYILQSLQRMKKNHRFAFSALSIQIADALYELQNIKSLYVLEKFLEKCSTLEIGKM
jgi:hypothetical protein